MMKIYFNNNYPMDVALRRFEQGTLAEHHLWGFSRLRHTEQVQFGTIVPMSGVERKAGRIGRALHALRQQVHGLREVSSGTDIAHYGYFNSYLLAGWLTRISTFGRRKASVMVHFPVKSWQLPLLRGFDRVLCLSKDVSDDLADHIASAKLVHMGWAVDLSFYPAPVPQVSQHGITLVAAGKDRRDYPTLLEGFLKTTHSGDRLKLFTNRSSRPTGGESDPRVTIVSAEGENNAIGERELLDHYASCDVIAIPLQNVRRVAGLTSLMDALAMGKPVVCTRNAGLDFDIEAIGAGLWIEPGDSGAWTSAINRMSETKAELAAWGEKGRSFAEKELNLGDYAARLLAVFRGACDK